MIDWAGLSAGHGGWFAGDGLHVDFAGARAFADDIRRAAAPLLDVPPAVPKDPAGVKPCGTLRRYGAHLAVYVVHGASKMTCDQARAMARRPPLARIPDWSVYERISPWRDLYVRADRRVIVGVADAISNQFQKAGVNNFPGRKRMGRAGRLIRQFQYAAIRIFVGTVG